MQIADEKGTARLSNPRLVFVALVALMANASAETSGARQPPPALTAAAPAPQAAAMSAQPYPP